MTKLDPKGNIIWTYPYGSTDEDDWGWSVFETPKSNIVFVGSTKSFGASLFDIYLVGTNADEEPDKENYSGQISLPLELDNASTEEVILFIYPE